MTPKTWDVSPVAERFGVNAGDSAKSGQLFAKNGLPSAWKPELVCVGLWEQSPSGAYGRMEYAFALKSFSLLDPFFPPAEDEECGPAHLAASKRIRDILWRWIFETKGVRPEDTAPSGHGVGGGVGYWFINYRAGDFEGTFSASIVPQGAGKAVLIASLTEARRARRPSPEPGLF